MKLYIYSNDKRSALAVNSSPLMRGLQLVVCRDGAELLRVPLDSSSKWNQEVGVENVVTLNFVSWQFVAFDAGACIEIGGETFKLKRAYKPRHINNSKYSYSMSFYGREHDAEDLLFCRLNQGEEDLESVFQYDGTPAELLEKVVENLNRKHEGRMWKVGEAVAATRQAINFNGVTCWEALGLIAQTFETEWWRDGDYINLTRCERGEAVALGYRTGLSAGLQQEEAENAVNWFTRLIPVGSTKNINKAVYGYDRLQLPGKEKYIEINRELGLKEHREEAAFAEIYPHRKGTVSAVYSEEKTNENTGDYTVYFFADDALPFDPDECMLPDQEIGVRFVTGNLAQKEFEVVWDKASERFEIINRYPNDGMQLPGGNMVPKKGDEYVLYNIAMPKEYYDAAEKEFASAVNEYIESSAVDASVYKAPTDYIYLDRMGIELKLGCRVRLMSEVYFGDGYKMSRITKISRRLDRLNDATIECRTAVVKSWKTSVDNSLNSMKYSVAKELEQVMIEVLQTGDTGSPADYNVLSALRSLRTFLRKDREDGTEFYTRFKAGLQAGRLDVDGKALFGDDVSSERFVSGANGKGWAVQQKNRTNAAGEEESYSLAEVDELVVRRSLKIFEMVMSQLMGENDNRVFAGMMAVERYEAATGIVWLKTENGKLYNPFRKGDVLMVQRYQGNEVVKQYELVVESAGLGNLNDGERRLDRITFGSFVGGKPEELISEGDTLVRVDSVSDEARKGLMQITSVGDNGPYLDVMRGMKTNPDDALKVRLGRLDGVRDEGFGEEQPSGYGLYAQNAFLRGRFVLSSGMDVETQLVAQEGHLKSSMQSVQKDYMTGRTVVYNPSFTEGLTGWQTQNVAEYHLLNGQAVFWSGGILKSEVELVSEDVYGEAKFHVEVRNATIRQLNELFTTMDGMQDSGMIDVVYAMKYRCASSAMLVVALEKCSSEAVNACLGSWNGAKVAVNGNINIVTSWGEELEFMKIDREIDAGDVLIVTKGYRLINRTKGEEVKYASFALPSAVGVRLATGINLLTAEVLAVKAKYDDYTVYGRWDGTGDLSITYCGEVAIYAIQLYSEPTEVRYATLFEQTDKLIRLAAQNFNADGTVRAESGILLKPDSVGITTIDSKGKMATIGTMVDGVVLLDGEEIRLKGRVTANGNVEIDDDGRLTAKEGNFTGEVNAGSGTIGKFKIGDGLEFEEDNYQVKLDGDRLEIGQKEGYAGLGYSWKSFAVLGRLNDGEETIIKAGRWLPTNSRNVTEYSPLVELTDESSYPTVAMKMRGACVLEGALLNRVAKLTLTSDTSPNVLKITEASRWIVENKHTAALNVYLPKLKDMLAMLGLTNKTDKYFAIPMSVTNLRGGKSISIRFQEVDDVYESGAGFVNWNGSTQVEMGNALAVGDTWEFILINDSANGYYAHITNYNV